jgi:hypothetical protein
MCQVGGVPGVTDVPGRRGARGDNCARKEGCQE